MLKLRHDRPARRHPGASSARRLAGVSRRDFVLPPEALALVKVVSDLDSRAERVRAELAADLAGIRQAAEQEVEEARRRARRELDEARRQAADERRKAAQRTLEVLRMRDEVEQARASLAHDAEVIEALLHERVRGFGLIGDAWADYEQAKAEQVASPC